MSPGRRNIFAKPGRLFERHFSLSRSTSSSSNADVPSAGPPPALQQSQPPTVSSPAPLSSAIPPEPLTSTSQAPTPSTLCSLQSPMLAPSLSDSTPQPPNSPFLLHAPGSSTSHVSTLQPLQRASFVGAHDFIIKDSQFIDSSSQAGFGLKKLLKSSMPDAFHDSAARYPPPECHLGTRKEYIAKVTNWAEGNSNHNEPILWMRGPFGIGKTAVAQSCAEVLSSKDSLAAALFFSRSDTDRDDPQRIFTSIAFQIATKCKSFSDVVDACIRRDPSLTTKSLSVQFNELLVRPLTEPGITRSEIDGHVVIIDGLDECRGSSEQCEIIRVIAASARDRTTPFVSANQD